MTTFWEFFAAFALLALMVAFFPRFQSIPDSFARRNRCEIDQNSQNADATTGVKHVKTEN